MVIMKLQGEADLDKCWDKKKDDNDNYHKATTRNIRFDNPITMMIIMNPQSESDHDN